jgi:deoxyribodipyrimidine photo-lyase
VDNTGLNYACSNYKTVYPIFIFTPEQIKTNPYKSDNAVQFMIESIKDLSTVSCFYNDNIKALKSIIKSKKDEIEAIVVNEDYTPYSVKRDKAIEKLCKKEDIEFVQCTDNMIQPDNLKSDGTAYKVFTPFYKNAKSKKVDAPSKYKPKGLKLLSGRMKDSEITKLYKKNKDLVINGGRTNGIKALNSVGRFKSYNKNRNFPSINTTRLSAHLKFGTISVRETYAKFKSKLGSSNELLKQLYWRDFYMVIVKHYPKLNKSNTVEKLNKIKWMHNKKKLDAWKEGKTGFPLVDAGMREMNKTGFMHNRLRMVVATFLIYNLQIDWRDGEKYFSQMLVDSDVSNNNGNWKWVAGIESFSNDYYKAMSIESQTKRFDEKGKYIKQWVPELKDVDSKHLADWSKHCDNYDVDYPDPIVDEKETRKDMIAKYKKYMKSKSK